MDLQKIISELREERENICAAIMSLERLSAGKRRGRPPAWLAALKQEQHTPPARRKVTAGRRAEGQKTEPSREKE